MSVDGRLIPSSTGFTIELRKDRPSPRKNFTCAHEVAHTFFSPPVPSSAYHRSSIAYNEPDAEEENLCNFAAAELLMPSFSISKIASDYVPSPKSLVDVALLFNTSLTATVIRLLKLRIWEVGFVMWRRVESKLEARWLCKRTGVLSYHPNIKIINDEDSSIYHTLKSGEGTSNWEYFRTDTGVWPSRVDSIRINSQYVLTLMGGATRSPVMLKQSARTTSMLPIDYTCECDGTGWRLRKELGRLVASRCRALQHSGHDGVKSF
jgi:hypothetical protein